jgi:hypothetical protein
VLVGPFLGENEYRSTAESRRRYLDAYAIGETAK